MSIKNRIGSSAEPRGTPNKSSDDNFKTHGLTPLRHMLIIRYKPFHPGFHLSWHHLEKTNTRRICLYIIGNLVKHEWV